MTTSEVRGIVAEAQAGSYEPVTAYHGSRCRDAVIAPDESWGDDCPCEIPDCVLDADTRDGREWHLNEQHTREARPRRSLGFARSRTSCPWEGTQMSREDRDTRVAAVQAERRRQKDMVAFARRIVDRRLEREALFALKTLRDCERTLYAQEV